MVLPSALGQRLMKVLNLVNKVLALVNQMLHVEALETDIFHPLNQAVLLDTRTLWRMTVAAPPVSPAPPAASLPDTWPWVRVVFDGSSRFDLDR